MKKALIYARVSSTGERQSNERQIKELTSYANTKGYEIARIIAINESATKMAAEERKAFNALKQEIHQGGIDVILVHEVSRIGRRVSDNAFILEATQKAGISIYIKEMGLETLNPDGSPNLAAEIVYSVMSSLAKAETAKLSQRIRSGMANSQKKAGRPKGAGKLLAQDMIDKYPKVIKELERGESVRRTAKLTGKGQATVARIRKAMKELEMI